MSHDRGCSCGREKWDYATCPLRDCPKQLDRIAAARIAEAQARLKPLLVTKLAELFLAHRRPEWARLHINPVTWTRMCREAGLSEEGKTAYHTFFNYGIILCYSMQEEYACVTIIQNGQEKVARVFNLKEE